jgi:hypothetical protein
MDEKIWFVVAGAVVVVGVGAFLLVKRMRSGPKVEEYLHFRCPGCKRRLRFHSRQTGHSGQCSHCGNKLTFPHSSQASD